MSQATRSINETLKVPAPVAPGFLAPLSSIVNFLPAILPIIGAALMVTARIKLGASAVPTNGPLIILALLCYITASSALLVNIWAPIKFLERLGLLVGSLGFFFNLSSWLIRWVEAGDREGWIRLTNQITGEQHFWWFFSYIPLTNLHDYSVAFAFGAAFGTLLISSRENNRFVGAVSFPLITIILLMAIFIGNSFIFLNPVLDSYWRPIHVSVASMSYGIALVSFALAVVYLIKDGVKIESMGVAITAFFIFGHAAVWLMGGFKGFDPLTLSYRLSPVVPNPDGSVFPLRAYVPIPGAGILFALSMLLLIGMGVSFLLYLYRNGGGNERMKRVGHWLLRASIVVQVATLGWLFYQVKTMKGVGSLIGTDQYYRVGRGLFSDRNEIAKRSIEDFVAAGANFMGNVRDSVVLDVKGNPIEFGVLFTILAASLFILIFSFRTERLRANLPSLEKIDSIIYKVVGVAFAGLAILLVTGAVWANESWGRYWGWDAKETGALVAWLAYGGYLHTRIAHGWSGRRGAYFALVGFLLVIFTYLGVSYILPGLHTYAGGEEF
jgi:ABC-type transport system involved in cytochrome c biogenesis permease subunit